MICLIPDVLKRDMSRPEGLEPVDRGFVKTPYRYAPGPAEITETRRSAVQYVNYQNAVAGAPLGILPIQQRLKAASVVTANQRVLAQAAGTPAAVASPVIAEVQRLCRGS